MHYYQFHIGDYHRDTSHLTLIEDIAYRRLLDRFYLDEKPLQREGIARKIGMREYEVEVLTVLDEFFIETDGGWINRRAQEQIQQYQGFKSAGARGAAKRWARGGDSPPISPPNEGPIANHKPITNNHKQEECKRGKKAAFQPPTKREALDFFESNGSGEDEAARFWYHYDANGWMAGRVKMKSWTSAAHKWIRTNHNGNHNGHKNSDSRSEQDRVRAAGFDFTRQLVEEARAREARERDGDGSH